MKAAGEFWDHEISEPIHTAWMARLPVRFYINEAVSGAPGSWPFDWFQATYPGLHFRRVLSVGCGTGPLERDLLHRGLCTAVDAFDASVVSLREARRAADAAGWGNRIRYFAADFNEPHLPRNTYDAVFFHQSLHHVAKLEKLLRAVLLALKPSGLLYLDELIGPSRTYWNEQTFAPWRALWASLPPECHGKPLPLPVLHADPSEAIRSGEIMRQLRIGFVVEQFRGYGGNLVAILLPHLPHASDLIVQRLIDREKQLLSTGASPFYAVVVARPKKGAARWVAALRYFSEPKLKRVGRALRAALSRRPLRKFLLA